MNYEGNFQNLEKCWLVVTGVVSKFWSKKNGCYERVGFTFFERVQSWATAVKFFHYIKLLETCCEAYLVTFSVLTGQVLRLIRLPCMKSTALQWVLVSQGKCIHPCPIYWRTQLKPCLWMLCQSFGSRAADEISSLRILKTDQSASRGGAE